MYTYYLLETPHEAYPDVIVFRVIETLLSGARYEYCVAEYRKRRDALRFCYRMNLAQAV